EIRRESGVGDELVKAYPICTPLSRYFYEWGTQERNCVIRNMKPLDQLTTEEIQVFPERAKGYVTRLALEQTPKVHFIVNHGESLSKANRADDQFRSWWREHRFDVSSTTSGWAMLQSWTPPALLVKVTDE